MLLCTGKFDIIRHEHLLLEADRQLVCLSVNLIVCDYDFFHWKKSFVCLKTAFNRPRIVENNSMVVYFFKISHITHWQHTTKQRISICLAKQLSYQKLKCASKRINAWFVPLVLCSGCRKLYFAVFFVCWANNKQAKNDVLNQIA